MKRYQIKNHMADVLETLAMCRFIADGAEDAETVNFLPDRIQVRASMAGNHCLMVTQRLGQWSAYYQPNEVGRLILKGFRFGNPPGSITMGIDAERILQHFNDDYDTTTTPKGH